ncbi:hypothetical protein HOLDEFILI_04264, partial [Holdemania filiformis DSM 12042]
DHRYGIIRPSFNAGLLSSEKASDGTRTACFQTESARSSVASAGTENEK